MRWPFRAICNKNLDTPAEEKVEEESPAFDIASYVVPGRYPRAEIVEATPYLSKANGRALLQLKVCVNPDDVNAPQYGHIYLTPKDAAVLYDALYIDRHVDCRNLEGEFIAVECFEVNLPGRTGYRLEIAGPKIVWKDN